MFRQFQIMANAICHLKCMLVGTVDVAEIGTIGIANSNHIGICNGLNIQRSRKHEQKKYQFTDTNRQTEEKTAPLPHFTLCLKCTNREELTDFLIALDNAATIEQAKSMTTLYLMSEKRGKLFFGHSFTGISHGKLHITLSL